MCECTTGPTDLARWNASHSRRWNHLRTVLRRAVPELEFFRGVEVQARGALHDHALLWSPVPLDRVAIARVAMRAGFGHELDLAPITSAKQVSYYVSKYVTKSTDLRASVPWWGDVIDFDTGEVTEGIVDGRYRTWSMSRQWGLRMADVRAEGLAFVRAQQAAYEAQLIDLLRSELGAVLLHDEISPSTPP